MPRHPDPRRESSGSSPVIGGADTKSGSVIVRTGRGFSPRARYSRARAVMRCASTACSGLTMDQARTLHDFGPTRYRFADGASANPPGLMSAPREGVFAVPECDTMCDRPVRSLRCRSPHIRNTTVSSCNYSRRSGVTIGMIHCVLLMSHSVVLSPKVSNRVLRYCKTAIGSGAADVAHSFPCTTTGSSPERSPSRCGQPPSSKQFLEYRTRHGARHT